VSSTWAHLAAHARSAYLRYSFTRGTRQEVDFLVEALGLDPGRRVLDVGCGPGRHVQALARRGCAVTGLDLAWPFLKVASEDPVAETEGARSSYIQGDAGSLPVRSHAFEAVICLCQGGFGLLGGRVAEEAALREMARVLCPGGRLALTAFSSWYAVRWLGEAETFDAASAVLAEEAKVKDPEGREESFPLRSTCFTPRELELMAGMAGLAVEGIYSVEPGRYARRAPELDLPEWLLVARRPRPRGDDGNLCGPSI
jgi:ubiquinone/menaquinone biosynthesis C-methylase UbiE